MAKADATDATHLNVEVTGIRVRSSFSAVMFGFMAGSDYVDSTVTFADADNHPVDHFKVSASYALGGIAGIDSMRMDWLYEKFTEKTLATLAPATAATQGDAALAASKKLYDPTPDGAQMRGPWAMAANPVPPPTTGLAGHEPTVIRHAMRE